MFRGATSLVALVLVLLAPAVASAARPEATTGAASNVAPDSVTVAGKVDPNGKEATYFFQYGTTTLYGAQTAVATAGAGTAPVNISATITGLAPATRYHYRLVTQNADGIRRGADRVFRTKPQPLGIVNFAATPNPVRPGAPTQLSGQLSGTNNAGRDVVLQANVWPYAGFVNVGNALVTGADGTFSFSVLSVPFTTQYRVVMAQRPDVVSPVVVVGAALKVNLWTKKVERHSNRSVSVRFSGNIKPGFPGVKMLIQRFRDDAWRTIATTRTEFAGTAKSTYSTRVRMSEGGRFRVVAEADAQYSSGVSRERDISGIRR